jgi:hypothetical protein
MSLEVDEEKEVGYQGGNEAHYIEISLGPSLLDPLLYTKRPLLSTSEAMMSIYEAFALVDPPDSSCSVMSTWRRGNESGFLENAMMLQVKFDADLSSPSLHAQRLWSCSNAEKSPFSLWTLTN